MVRITESLVRKKSEHNELMISTLEEISLHQEDIERIEHIQNWCRNLKILLLQSNLIAKIENLYKLKKLEYLNLAVNNIERIENLEQLESLEKLDLTLNFIGELTSVECLKNNYNLKQLILTGNPCTDYSGYRDYIICILPQLEILDGEEIKRSDRIRAEKGFTTIREGIIQAEALYRIERDEQKIRVQQKKSEMIERMQGLNEEEQMKLFWDTKSEHCPETRYEISAQQQKAAKKCNNDNEKKLVRKERRLFAPCGRPYNLNQAKLEFRFIDEPDRYELDLKVYKFLDTSLINVDVQPNYVRVKIKGKYFQLALNEEVQTSESLSKRSQITGQLLIVMPKLHYHQKNKDLIYCLEEKNQATPFPGLTKVSRDSKESLKGTVNYKNIIKPTVEKHSKFSSSNDMDDNDDLPPPLI